MSLSRINSLHPAIVAINSSGLSFVCIFSGRGVSKSGLKIQFLVIYTAALEEVIRDIRAKKDDARLDAI